MVCLFNLFSEAEPKGTDCLGKFMEMNECMKRHPDLYPESAEDVQEEEEQEVDSEIVTENENTDGQIVESKSWKWALDKKCNSKTLFSDLFQDNYYWKSVWVNYIAFYKKLGSSSEVNFYQNWMVAAR